MQPTCDVDNRPSWLRTEFSFSHSLIRAYFARLLFVIPLSSRMSGGNVLVTPARLSSPTNFSTSLMSLWMLVLSFRVSSSLSFSRWEDASVSFEVSSTHSIATSFTVLFAVVFAAPSSAAPGVAVASAVASPKSRRTRTFVSRCSEASPALLAGVYVHSSSDESSATIAESSFCSESVSRWRK